MKKLLVAAAVLALTATAANAQDRAGGDSKGALGAITTQTVVAGVVAVGVAAAIISNNRSTSVDPGPGPGPTPDKKCNAGDGSPVNGICTGVQVVVTGTGTTTGTTTVTYTYAAQ